VTGDIECLTVADVIALYDVAMEESGQPPSALVREEALQSAVHHPRNLGYYQNAGLAEQAVELMVHIVSAHPWVDGNKRASAIAFYAFLAKNGVRVPDEDAFRTAADRLVGWLSASSEERNAIRQEMISLVNSWMV
jgi:death-on-curing protein